MIKPSIRYNSKLMGVFTPEVGTYRFRIISILELELLRRERAESEGAIAQVR